MCAACSSSRDWARQHAICSSSLCAAQRLHNDRQLTAGNALTVTNQLATGCSASDRPRLSAGDETLYLGREGHAHARAVYGGARHRSGMLIEAGDGPLVAPPMNSTNGYRANNRVTLSIDRFGEIRLQTSHTHNRPPPSSVHCCHTHSLNWRVPIARFPIHSHSAYTRCRRRRRPVLL